MSEAQQQQQSAGEEPQPKYWNKIAEETLRKTFFKEQRKACHEPISAYTQCAKQEGFLVPWNCRDKLAASNACLAPLTSDEMFRQYKQAKIDEWVAQGVLVRPKDF